MKKLSVLLLALTLILCAMTGFAQEYTATAKGFAGDVTVTLTVEDGAITAAKAEGPNETAGIGTKALENIPASMVDQNSVTVDAIASVTFTSNEQPPLAPLILQPGTACAV